MKDKNSDKYETSIQSTSTSNVCRKMLFNRNLSLLKQILRKITAFQLF